MIENDAIRTIFCILRSGIDQFHLPEEINETVHEKTKEMVKNSKMRFFNGKISLKFL